MRISVLTSTILSYVLSYILFYFNSHYFTRINSIYFFFYCEKLRLAISFIRLISFRCSSPFSLSRDFASRSCYLTKVKLFVPVSLGETCILPGET